MALARLSVAIYCSRFVCARVSDPVPFVASFSSVFAVAHVVVIVQLGFGALLVFVARYAMLSCIIVAASLS